MTLTHLSYLVVNCMTASRALRKIGLSAVSENGGCAWRSRLEGGEVKKLSFSLRNCNASASVLGNPFRMYTLRSGKG